VIALELMMCSGFSKLFITQTYDQLLDENAH